MLFAELFEESLAFKDVYSRRLRMVAALILQISLMESLTHGRLCVFCVLLQAMWIGNTDEMEPHWLGAESNSLRTYVGW